MTGASYQSVGLGQVGNKYTMVFSTYSATDPNIPPAPVITEGATYGTASQAYPRIPIARNESPIFATNSSNTNVIQPPSVKNGEDPPVPILTTNEGKNICVNEGHIYPWKDTIIFRFRSHKECLLEYNVVTNHEYELVEGSKYAPFQTFNMGTRKTFEVDHKRLELKRSSGLPSAHRLRKRKKHEADH